MLSIVLSAQPASFSALAYQGDLEENLQKIQSFGYTGVELAVRDPGDLDVPSLNSWVTKLGLTVTAVGTGQAYSEEGLSFTDQDENIRREAIQRIKDQIHFASRFKAMVIIGLIRGNPDKKIEKEQVQQWLLEAFDECAQEDQSVKLVIEPCNRYEADLINNVDEGLKFIRELGRENVGLLLDTFHMNIEEPVIEESLRKYADLIKHVHFADSNRWPPGYGHIDFKKIMDTLKEIDYSGYISFEMLPMPDPDTAAKHAIEYIKGIEG
ncbi:MAG: sugar phosphate isomerase/epimerase [Actinomycetia bacterium]|nr:sugar phosphate isomerase/epimerase [Actinomycetes bacterium]